MSDEARTRAVTSQDVARAAGVSRSTVSFVLNGVESIALSEETRERVRRAAHDLGYVPHSAARALRSGYSGLVLLPTPAGPLGRLVSEWTDRLEDELSVLGLTFVMFGGRHLDVQESLRAWSELRPTAVLTLGGTPLAPEQREFLTRTDTRVLVATAEEQVPGTLTLVTRQAETGAIAVEHLVDRGRRRIGILTPTDRLLQHVGSSRARTAERVAAERGVATTTYPVDYSLDSARAVAEAISRDRVDGVFAFDDDYALLLLGALRERGVAVPDDVALVGVDDLLVGAVSMPRLSTIRVSFPDAHEVAAEIRRLSLDARLARGTLHAEPPHLVVRESS